MPLLLLFSAINHITMSSPRRLFAAAALWLVTSSQRARPRRDLGASSAATSGQRYKPQRVATYAGPRLGDTVNRSASPLPRPWSACERCGVVTTINPPSEAILRVGNASGWCLVRALDCWWRDVTWSVRWRDWSRTGRPRTDRERDGSGREGRGRD